MQSKFWIFLITLLFSYTVDFQQVMGQGVTLSSEELLESFHQTDGINLSTTFPQKSNPNSVPSFMVAQPLSSIKGFISKVNTDNWTRIEAQKMSIQKIKSDPSQQFYIRMDKVHLGVNESLEIHSLQFGEIIETLDSGEDHFIGGPYRSDEIGLVLRSERARAIENVDISEIYVGAMDFGYDSSYECHKNISCDEGKDFINQERGVVRIRMVLDEGIGFCTGALINNTSLDRTPYILSAFHCQDGFTPFFDMWSFDFGYESFSCADPDTEPAFTRVTGCEMVAGYGDTDMLLLKVTEVIPDAANAYFNGWNRIDTYEPQGAVLIHHPRGDIKKVSVDNDPVVPFNSTLNWDNGISTSAKSHLVTRFDESSYQGGSSGGPLYDRNGHIIAQLHGGPDGDEMCTIGIGYHGRFSRSWDGGGTPETRLNDWLDPAGTGDTILQGLEFNAEGSSFISFVGKLVTPDGIAIPNVEVSIKGDKEESFVSGSDGRFVFDNLPKSGSYTLSFRKDSNHGNGVSAIDLVQIMNHILGTSPLFGIFQQRSADANNDGNVSSQDLVQILNIVIGKTDRLPNNTSWGFEPAVIEVNTSDIQSFNRQIIGYKIGDVNFSANPRR